MEKSAYLQMAKTEQDHWWFCGRRAILQRLIAQYLADKPAQHILEVGAGTGGNLAMLSRFGKLSATEMNDEARQIANARKQIAVQPGTLPNDLPDFPQKFNLICLFDVLEHVEDDTASLSAIRKLLAPDGVILLTVPAHPWLWSRHDKLLHHKRRYTRDSLYAHIDSAGMCVQRFSYFNTFLFPAAVVARLLDRLRRGEAAYGAEMPSSFVNAALKRIFISEAALLARFNLPFGVSMLAIVRLNS
jgi:SAM-dependent methyltransferase